MPTNDRLFIGMYPEGIVYADRGREEHGDYMRVAFLPYSTLKLEVNEAADPDLITKAKTDAGKYKPGMTINLPPQTMELGWKLKKEP